MKALLPIILIIVSITGFFMWINPHYGNIKTLKVALADSDNALSKAQQLEAYRQKLVDEENAFNPADVAKLQKLLPNTVDSVRLAIDMQSVASHFGLSLKNIQLGVGQAPATNSAQGAVGPSGQQYGSLALSFSVATSYENLMLFLKDLERSLRIVEIKSIGFSADNNKPDSYTVAMSINAFWVNARGSALNATP